MAFTINVKAALVFVVAIPALSVVVFGVMIASIPMYRKVQARLDKVMQSARENLTGVRVIRAFNKEEDEKRKFEDANQLLVKQQVFVGKISALMNPLTYIIINGAIIALIWTGAWQVEGGIITQGEVMALVNYMSQILVELVKLANLIINITKSLACAKRIAGVFEIESSIQEHEKAVSPAASSDDTCARRPGGTGYRHLSGHHRVHRLHLCGFGCQGRARPGLSGGFPGSAAPGDTGGHVCHPDAAGRL